MAEILLAEYTNNGKVSIPITLVYDSGENTVTNKYSLDLVLPEENNTPVVEEQPTNVSCGKDEQVKLSVSVKKPAKGELSYQWQYSDTNGYVDIENANQNDFYPVTTYQGVRRYRCVVTNTVDDKKYVAETNTVSVRVELSYIATPVVVKQPGTFKSRTDDSPYKTVYVVGAIPDNLYVKFRSNDILGKSSYKKNRASRGLSGVFGIFSFNGFVPAAVCAATHPAV